MKPLHFGSSSRALFGLYHPPRPPAREAAAVLCNPGVQEYNMTHWAFRRLGELLAQRVATVIAGSYDALTGLLNRPAFEHRVQAMRLCEPAGRGLRLQQTLSRPSRLP